MKISFQRITTKDGLELHGLLYEPESKTNSILVHVHSWIGNFYENKFLDYIAKEVISKKVAFFGFNNCGAGIITDFIKRKKSKFIYKRIGGSLEKFNDCILDIEAVINFVAARRYKNIILEGHSLGCQKVIFYKYKRQDKRIRGLILLGPVDDVSYVKRLLGSKYEKSLELAKGIIKKRSDDRLPKWIEFYPLMTAEKFLDVADPTALAGRILYRQGKFKEIKNTNCPILAVFGSKDDYEREPEEMLEILGNKINNCDTILIKNANHWFDSQEEKLAKLIANWLKSL